MIVLFENRDGDIWKNIITMKTQILFSIIVSVSFTSLKAQNIQFTDTKFKAIILNANPGNQIAYDFQDNPIKVDANNDGEIQTSEAENVKRLSIQLIYPNNNQENYFNDNAPESLDDLKFFKNAEYITINDTKATKVEFVNNNKVKSVITSSSGQSFNLKNYLFEGCHNLENLNNMISPESSINNMILKIKNCSISNKELNLNNIKELYLEGTNVENIYINSSSLTKVLLPNETSIKYISLHGTSQDLPEIEINAENCINLTQIEATSEWVWERSQPSRLTKLNVNNCINLKIIKGYNPTFLDFSQSGLVALQEIITDGSCYRQPNYSCRGSITGINLQNLPSLKKVQLTDQPLQSSIDFKGLYNLEYIDLSNNLHLTKVDVNGLTKLKELNLSLLKKNNDGVFSYPDSQLEEVNASNCTSLATINIDYQKQLKTVDLENCSSLQTFRAMGEIDREQVVVQRSLESINLKGCTGLKYLNVSANKINELDINDCPNLTGLACSFNNMKKIFMKNGKLNIDDNIIYSLFSGNDFDFICADDFEVDMIKSYNPNDNTNIASYCSFFPGGNYNTITGKVRFDENGNRCDSNDGFLHGLKLKIDDETNIGSSFVEKDGTYKFYTQDGNFNIISSSENPDLFSFSPANFTTNFSDNNSNVSTQDICASRNGTQKDVEVVFAPIINAIPDSNARYKLVYRNKGNTTLSGTVKLVFDNTKMSFISAQFPVNISGNEIYFNYDNLKPYENRVVEFVLKVNASIPNDILNFTANITPFEDDINANDNTFSFKQTIADSLIPNDIVCLEGKSVAASEIGKYLHYIINFENTSTDDIKNIVVEMDINPADFDINTLQLQNATFPVYSKIIGNKVELILEKANLKSGEHGSINFKMKSQSTKTLGDSVSNKANVYFDYDFPVQTNNAVTNFEEILMTNEVKDNSVKIYPIPTKGNMTIETVGKILLVEIYDAQGRIIQKQRDDNSKINFNASSGTYYIKIKTEKGTSVKKIIKE